MTQKRTITTLSIIAFCLVLSVLAIDQARDREWLNVFLCVQCFFISLIPYYLERRFDFFIPEALRIGIVLFMGSTVILGEIASFYSTFVWWDIILHGVATIGLTIIGLILITKAFTRQALRTTALLSSFLAFSFAMTLSVIWEIYEFLIDEFGSPEEAMQPSNTDTMTDLMIASFTAGIVAYFGYRYLRWRERNIVGSLVEEGKNGGDEPVVH